MAKSPILRAEIDLGARPADIPNLRFYTHDRGSVVTIEKKGRSLYIDGKRVRLMGVRRRIHGGLMDLSLKNKPVLNARVLDFLLENQEFIPNYWKKKRPEKTHLSIFFWGTKYFDVGTFEYTRCLTLVDDKWQKSGRTFLAPWGLDREQDMIALLVD